MSVQSVSVQAAVSAPVVSPSVVSAGAAAMSSSAASANVTSTHAANSTAAATANPSADSVKQAVDKLNQVVSSVAPDLQFSTDPESHRQVVQLVDNQTAQVVMQFPSKDALSIAHAIDRFMQQGALLKEKA